MTTVTMNLTTPEATPEDGYGFRHDVTAVLDALSDYGDRITENHFASFPIKQFAEKAGFVTGSETHERVLRSLRYHSDNGDIQFAVGRKAKNRNIYVRWLSTEEDTNPITTPVCRPMNSTDVHALCAMVEDGLRGVYSLTGLPKSDIESWRVRGISSKREDARQKLLREILAVHLAAGRRLINEPLQVTQWAEEQGELRTKRLAWFAELLTLAENYTPPAPEPEPEQEKPVSTKTTTEKATRMCGVCAKAPLKGEEMLCRACSIKLMKQSGMGTVEIAEPLHGRDWRSPVEKAVAENGAEIGLAQETYCAVAAGLHQANLAIEEMRKQGHGISLGALGVYVNGINLDEVKPPEQAPTPDDVEIEEGRKGYVRVLGKWVINPSRLQDSTQKLQSRLGAIAGPLQRLLVDLQDVEGGKELRAAIGSHGVVQDLMEAGSLTYMLQYLVNDLVGQLTPDTSVEG